MNCLARIPRLYYPILSLVSKRYRSLLTSLELYDIRTLLGRTENCLYVSLRLSSESKPCWFTLCRKPTPIPNPSRNPNSRWFTSCFRPYKILKNRTRKEENKSSEKFMVSVPIRNDCPQFGLTSTLGTTIGSNIYMIGGHIDGAVSSRVFILDCRSHTWHEAPSMQMSRKCPLVSVLDGKIYVVDRKNVADPSNLIEFFDPKIQIWEHVPIPSEELRGSYITRSLVLGEKLYLFGYKSTVYKPKEQIWDVVGLEKCLRWVRNSSSCVIDNACSLYCTFQKDHMLRHRGTIVEIFEGFENIT
ncbi:unnamed protein product [Arabidopsis lyrata]|nr:unnamed protein product [Arabidopsis lyrata]